MPITQVKKRDNRVVKFDQTKITEAIWKAAISVGGQDHSLAEKISNQVVAVLEVFYKDQQNIPTVEQIQDLVEKILIEGGYAKTAKAFILYRQKRSELREQKSLILGQETTSKLSLNAVRILEQRYLRKNVDGKITETPEQMFKRVADFTASVQAEAGTSEKFYQMLANLDFLPGSSILMNADTDNKHLTSCIALVPEDNMESIFENIKRSAIFDQNGSGLSINLSRLRPRGNIVHSTHSQASGPVAFLRVFDAAINAIKPASRRHNKHLALLKIDHPDILEFIGSKEQEESLKNFKLGFILTENFIKSVINNGNYELINPVDSSTVNSLHAPSVYELILASISTKNGAIIIFEEAFRKNQGQDLTPTPNCEIALDPSEACFFGAINLGNFYSSNGKINFEKLKNTTELAVQFLDNIINLNEYLYPEIETVTKNNRKTGIGVMGFAELLFKLKIPYNSESAIKIAEEIGAFISETTKTFSAKFNKKTDSSTIAIIPAANLSLIAETTTGIEPATQLVSIKYMLDGSETLTVNRKFEESCKQLDVYSKELMREIAKTGSIQKIKNIPGEIKKIFVLAGDIEPEWHLKIQAAFQKNCDGGSAKILNLPPNNSIEENKQLTLKAYTMGCKNLCLQSKNHHPKTVNGNNYGHPEKILTEYRLQRTKPVQNLETIPEEQATLPFNDLIENKKREIKKAEEVIPPPVINIA